MFRSLIFGACVVGVVTGLLLTAVQALGVTPTLLAAEQLETYESSAEVAHAHHGHTHGEGEGHYHDGSAWAPEDGVERWLFTALSNVLAAVGFSAILLVIMNQLYVRDRLRLTPAHGLFIGLCAYFAVFVAPAIGLPPEIPGTASAGLMSRQLWWLVSVLSVATGLGVLCLARGKIKALALPLMGLPYVFVPIHNGPLFDHPDATAIASLTVLHRDFIWVSAMTNLFFWLSVGVLCAVVLQRLYKNNQSHHERATA
ncbi:CbtA family protein [Marinimicrobium locisalis]|uniref:CbtA family protein n=1 Tax=Marinimicrobium locisalis TaxID=546022 RepID=UPI0032216B6E